MSLPASAAFTSGDAWNGKINRPPSLPVIVRIRINQYKKRLYQAVIVWFCVATDGDMRCELPSGGTIWLQEISVVWAVSEGVVNLHFYYLGSFRRQYLWFRYHA
ncbi:hypothetical protein HED52_22020 [Ochrobactrum ciceri]|uniref:Uncharacterized protein n=1 Tax=Brucella ciceri TaxID=391287 RepID=A0ABX1DWD6_9HYPH|nr:hypothetical protein [Brucella ciceri]